MARDPVERVCRWHPVEPELTHFVDIISLTFDIGTDRGTSDTYRPFVERPSGQPLALAAGAVLTFNQRPAAAGSYPSAVPLMGSCTSTSFKTISTDR